MTVKNRGDEIDETEEETTPETEEEKGTPEGSEGDGAEPDADSSGEEKPETGEGDVPDSESESETDSEVDEKDEKSDSDYMLPKSRYDAAKRRGDALQTKLDRMEAERAERIEATRKTQPEEGAEKKEPPSTRVAELDELITDALLDGDKDEARKLRTEQRELERESLREELARSSTNAASQAREQVSLDATVDFLETTYNELNPRDKKFDQAAVEELETLRHAFQSTGEYTASQALLKAAKYKFPDLPPLTEAPVTKSDKEKIKKAIDSANKQPPDLKGVGDDASTGGIQEDIDPSKLSIKDLEALPEATLARLRGDIL